MWPNSVRESGHYGTLEKKKFARLQFLFYSWPKCSMQAPILLWYPNYRFEIYWLRGNNLID